MKSLIYARVSSKNQGHKGYSIPAQWKLLREHTASHNLAIVREFY
jgi:hypothetical protein